MTLTRWSPVRGLAALEIDRLNRMFEATFNGEPIGASNWVPAVDIFESGNNDVVVKADLPDLKRDDIKVTFEDNKGWWSVPGTVSRGQDPSMNLQFFGVDTPMLKNGQPAPEAPIRSTILHEFGHALGLLHEHQSPNANCDAEIDWDAAYKIGAGIGWDKGLVDRNFRQLASTTSLNATEVDRKSIMHYSLPVWIFKAREKSPCFVQPNYEISEGDRAFLSRVYPKPEVVATRGVTQPSITQRRTALIEEYRGLLQKAGIEKGKAEDLVKEFSATLPTK
jgi:hypothetical protein